MKALCLYFHIMPLILFLKILENKIWNFGRNLPWATFGSEGLKERFKISKIAKFESDLLKIDEDIAPQSR